MNEDAIKLSPASFSYSNDNMLTMWLQCTQLNQLLRTHAQLIWWTEWRFLFYPVPTNSFFWKFFSRRKRKRNPENCFLHVTKQGIVQTCSGIKYRTERKLLHSYHVSITGEWVNPGGHRSVSYYVNGWTWARSDPYGIALLEQILFCFSLSHTKQTSYLTKTTTCHRFWHLDECCKCDNVVRVGWSMELSLV